MQSHREPRAGLEDLNSGLVALLLHKVGRQEGLQKDRRRRTAGRRVAAREARTKTAHPAGCLEVLRARRQIKSTLSGDSRR